MPMAITLDIRGQICPSCLLLTLREINRNAAALREGATELLVFTDDRQAAATVPAAAEHMGLRCEVTADAGDYRFRIYTPPP